jgi:hypothetical protein
LWTENAWHWIVFDALDVCHVPNKFHVCAAVSSNPLDAAGAVAGMLTDCATPAIVDDPIASDQTDPVHISVAAVPPPVDKTTASSSSPHVTFVFAVVLNVIAPDDTTVTDPSLKSNVNVPGVAVRVEIRPDA